MPSSSISAMRCKTRSPSSAISALCRASAPGPEWPLPCALTRWAASRSSCAASFARSACISRKSGSTRGSSASASARVKYLGIPLLLRQTEYRPPLTLRECDQRARAGARMGAHHRPQREALDRAAPERVGPRFELIAHRVVALHEAERLEWAEAADQLADAPPRLPPCAHAPPRQQPPAPARQNRLDAQEGANPCLCPANAAAALQILQRIEDG